MGWKLALFVALLPLAVGTAGCHGWSRHSAPPMPGTVPSTPKDRAIAAVLSSPSGEGFGFFPNHAGREPCAIPEGGPTSRRIRGVCTTQVIPRPGYSGQTAVVFAEVWPWRAFHYAGKPRRPQRHSWMFAVPPSGKVILVRQNGAFPPQWVR
jgi:hypothetical protein